MYIRTKDGVYDTSKGLYTPSIKMWAIGTVTIYDEDILKQSENLEELCDEFVDDNQNYIIQNPNILKSIKRNQCLKDHNIYGAIWTEWGLKYVAKMNDRGELELI